MKLLKESNIGKIYRLYYEKHRLFYKFSIAILSVCSMIPIIESYLNVQLLDKAIPEKNMGYVLKLLVIFTLTCTANMVLGYLMQLAMTKKNNNIAEEMKINIANGIHRHFIGKNLEENSRLTVVLVEDVMTIIGFMSSSLVSLIIHCVMICAFAVYLVRYSVLLSIVTFITAFIQSLTVPMFAGPLKKTSEEFRINSESELGYLNSAVSSMKVINTYGRISDSIERYKKIIFDFKNISVRNLKAGASQEIVTGSISLISNIIIIAFGVRMMINGDLTIGIFVAFFNVNDIIKSAFGSVFSFNSAYQSFKVSSERYLSTMEKYPNKYCKGEIISSIDDIEFNNAKISIDGLSVADSVSCLFKKGSKSLIIGANGCGKSSIMNAICGFLPVEKGMLTISGIDINDIAPDSLRKHISCCFQDDLFIQDTVRANICTQEQMKKNRIKFDSIIDLLEIDRNRIEDIIDCSAHGFSGGELQRISLARTLMKSSDIYLFDESFCSQDVKKKPYLFRNICSFLEEKTVIFISHDKEIYGEAEKMNIQCIKFNDMIRV